MKRLRWLISISLILLLTIGLQPVSAVSQSNAETEQQVNNEPTHNQITALTDQFMRILVQDTDSNYKVVNYNLKEALLTAFEQVTIREVAIDFVDFYYREKADGLYILPTETPPWFEKDNKYRLEQLGQNKVKVVQTNHSYLHDTYTIEFEFTFDDEWKITNITAQ